MAVRFERARLPGTAVVRSTAHNGGRTREERASNALSSAHRFVRLHGLVVILRSEDFTDGSKGSEDSARFQWQEQFRSLAVCDALEGLQVLDCEQIGRWITVVDCCCLLY